MSSELELYTKSTDMVKTRYSPSELLKFGAITHLQESSSDQFDVSLASRVMELIMVGDWYEQMSPVVWHSKHKYYHWNRTVIYDVIVNVTISLISLHTLNSNIIYEFTHTHTHTHTHIYI